MLIFSFTFTYFKSTKYNITILFYTCRYEILQLRFQWHNLPNSYFLMYVRIAKDQEIYGKIIKIYLFLKSNRTELGCWSYMLFNKTSHGLSIRANTCDCLLFYVMSILVSNFTELFRAVLMNFTDILQCFMCYFLSSI